MSITIYIYIYIEEDALFALSSWENIADEPSKRKGKKCY